MNRLWKRFDQSLDDDSGLHGIRRLVNNATMTEIKFEKGGNWLNYEAGLGIILHSDNTFEIFPIRCKGSGYLQQSMIFKSKILLFRNMNKIR